MNASERKLALVDGETRQESLTCPSPDRVAVVIAVATYARPEGIKVLLPLLIQQAESAGFSSWVLVVDNNSQPDAREFVEPFLGRSVRYVHEPVPGISAARNRALSESDGADAIVFIDDDEIPSDAWLMTLVKSWLDWQCAAVAGPVQSQFAQRPDEWVIGSGVFDRRRAPTGSMLQGAATNNLLLDLHWLHSRDIRFDARFGITGGSDTLLTREIVRAGGRIRWCDDAEVREIVPADRSTRRWVLRRTLRTSNDWSRVHLALTTSRRERVAKQAELIARGGWRILRGSVSLLRAVITRRTADRAAGSCEVARGVGMAVGALGFVRSEYTRNGQA